MLSGLFRVVKKTNCRHSAQLGPCRPILDSLSNGRPLSPIWSMRRSIDRSSTLFLTLLALPCLYYLAERGRQRA